MSLGRKSTASGQVAEDLVFLRTVFLQRPQDFLKRTRILHQFSCRYTQQKVADTIMNKKNMPHMYRVEMVPKMVCLMNKCITLGVYNVILEERFYRRKSNFHIAKCCTYQKNGRKSLTIRQKMCICGIFT